MIALVALIALAIGYVVGRLHQIVLDARAELRPLPEKYRKEITPFTPPRSADLYDFPAKEGRRLRIVEGKQ